MLDTVTEAPVRRTEIDDHPAIDYIREELAKIDEKVTTGYTLADAIREGSSCTDQAVGSFRQGDNVCALSAAYISAKARGYIS